MHYFLHVCNFSSFGRGSFPALSAVRYAGGPHVHYGASLGPGRAPWRVLWTFKVARAGAFTGSLSTEPQPSKTKQTHTKQ